MLSVKDQGRSGGDKRSLPVSPAYASWSIRRSGKAEDVFIQRRDKSAYALTVTAPKRDADLLDKARAGLRFDE